MTDNKKKLIVNEKACLKCFNCAGICPVGAIDTVEGEIPHPNMDKCTNCGKCVQGCMMDAIKFEE